MSVSVSIVTYQSRAHIARCLDSVRDQGDLVTEVIVADNGSDDGTAEWIRARHPEAKLRLLGRNRGYAAAHNGNFARARGTYFLALNPDVILGKGALARMVDALRGDSELGAVTGRLLVAGDRRRIDSAGIAYSPGRTRFIDRGRGREAARFASDEDVFGACGAAALYRSTALRCVSRRRESPFAERFFMYYEDVDLAWRLRRAGWRTRYLCRADSQHVRGGSGAHADFVEYHLVRNRLWLSLRNASWRELVLELPGLVTFELAKLLQAGARPHLRAALRDQLRGVPACLAERRAARSGG